MVERDIAGLDAGLHRASAPAPADCFGKEKVVLRLQVADKVTDIAPSSSASTYPTNLGIEKGTLTPEITAANCQVRIGTLTIRYN